MSTFERGDIVRVEYVSARLLHNWMDGLEKVGPGDVGIVKYSTVLDNASVTVEFPMIGCFAVHSSNLRLVQRAEAGGDYAGAR